VTGFANDPDDSLRIQNTCMPMSMSPIRKCTRCNGTAADNRQRLMPKPSLEFFIYFLQRGASRMAMCGDQTTFEFIKITKLKCVAYFHTIFRPPHLPVLLFLKRPWMFSYAGHNHTQPTRASSQCLLPEAMPMYSPSYWQKVYETGNRL